MTRTGIAPVCEGYEPPDITRCLTRNFHSNSFFYYFKEPLSFFSNSSTTSAIVLLGRDLAPLKRSRAYVDGNRRALDVATSFLVVAICGLLMFID